MRSPPPRVRQARAALASAHAHQLPPDVIARREAALADANQEDRIERAVTELVDGAPRLTAEQLDTLSCLLASAAH